MKLRFLANVDPTDYHRVMDGIDIEETLFIVISKTFTTAETMLNAKTCRDAVLNHFNNAAGCLSKHLCAVSTNLKATK